MPARAAPKPTPAVRAVLAELGTSELRTLARHHRLETRGARDALVKRLGEQLQDDLGRLLSADSPWLPLFWSDLLATRFGARRCATYHEMRAELLRRYPEPTARAPGDLLRERVSRVRARPELRRWVAAALDQPEGVVLDCLRYDHGNTTLASWLTYAEVYVATVTGQARQKRPWTETLAPLVSLCMGVALADGPPPARAAVRVIRRRLQAWQELNDREILPLRELMRAGPPDDVVLTVARLLVRQPLAGERFFMNLFSDVALAGGKASRKQIAYLEEIAAALHGGAAFFRPWREYLQGNRARPPGRDEYEAWVFEGEEDTSDEADREPSGRDRRAASVARHPMLDDCLRLLGLVPPVSLRDVKAAYRRLALAHHPDRHMQDARSQTHSQELMVRINVAYQRAIELLALR